MKKAILVTGGTGFIGKNIIESLSSKYKIYSLERKNTTLKKCKTNNYSVISFSDPNNIFQLIKNIKIDYIIHAATYYKKKDDEVNFKEIINANILLGIFLINICSKKKIKKFINFSTCWENYNNTKDNPFNLYASTKLAFKKIVNYYSKKNNFTKFYNIYLMDTFGENDTRFKIINEIKKGIKSNKPIKIISENLYLNVINVKDIISGIYLILTKPLNAGDYSLVNNKFFRIKDILRKINEKKKIKYKFATKRKIKEKIFKFKKIKGWKPKYSNINNIVDLVI